MPYCNNCGTQVNENSKFCENCGRPINNQQYGGQPQYSYQYPPQQQYGQYQYAHPVRPKTPGKGIGIASLPLGIVGLFYAFIFFLVTISEGGDPDILPAILMLSPLSIMALSFANASARQGYRNGISNAGLVTGIIGLIGYILTFLANID